MQLKRREASEAEYVNSEKISDIPENSKQEIITDIAPTTLYSTKQIYPLTQDNVLDYKGGIRWGDRYLARTRADEVRYRSSVAGAGGVEKNAREAKQKGASEKAGELQSTF